MKFTIICAVTALLAFAVGAHAQGGVSGTQESATILPVTTTGASSQPISASTSVSSRAGGPSSLPSLPNPGLSTKSAHVSSIASHTVPGSPPKKTAATTTSAHNTTSSNAAFPLVVGQGGAFAAVLGGVIAAIL